jgi:hypothetical protein
VELSFVAFATAVPSPTFATITALAFREKNTIQTTIPMKRTQLMATLTTSAVDDDFLDLSFEPVVVPLAFGVSVGQPSPSVVSVVVPALIVVLLALAVVLLVVVVSDIVVAVMVMVEVEAARQLEFITRFPLPLLATATN